jgi:hypothetical protein
MSAMGSDDAVGQAAKRVHDAIDFNSSIPVDGKDALHDLAGLAEKVVHGVTDASRDVVETAAIVAMETTDQIQQRYKRRTRIINVLGGGIITGLIVALLISRRRS